MVTADGPAAVVFLFLAVSLRGAEKRKWPVNEILDKTSPSIYINLTICTHRDVL